MWHLRQLLAELSHKTNLCCWRCAVQALQVARASERCRSLEHRRFYEEEQEQEQQRMLESHGLRHEQLMHLDRPT